MVHCAIPPLRKLWYLEEEDESSEELPPKEPEKPCLGWGKLTIYKNKK